MRLHRFASFALALTTSLAPCACGSSGDSASAAPDATTDTSIPVQDDGGDSGGDASSADEPISVQPPIDDADTPPTPPSDAGDDDDAGDGGHGRDGGNHGNPGGPWVAFVSNRSGDFDIYLVHPDGTGLLTIVGGTGNDLYPSWSPDGAKIAFASNRASDAGVYQLYVVDVASGVLTPTPTNLGGAVSPAWSPDGTTLALGGAGGLYVVPAAGGTATPLTTGGYRDNSPAWAPDSSLVYFSSNRGDAGTFDTWSVQPDGGAIQQVTTGTNILGGPAISPDAGSIAFAQQGSSTQVALFSFATKASTVFTAMNDYEPAFAPSGAQIAVTSTRYAADNPEIVLLGVPGATSPYRLTNSPSIDGQAAYQPAH